MTDDDYVRLRDLIRSTADASGWASSLPDGAVGRLIPGEPRRPGPFGRPLPQLSGGPAGLGIVLVTPVPSGGFVVLARFDPTACDPTTWMLRYDHHLRLYDGLDLARLRADDLVERGHAPSRSSRYRTTRALWRVDPPNVLLPPRADFDWKPLPDRVEFELMPHLRPVRFIDPAVAAPVLALRPPIRAIPAAAAIYQYNRLETARRLAQDPTSPSGLAAAAPGSALEIVWRSRSALLGACARYMAEDGADAAACGRLAARYVPADDVAEIVRLLHVLQPSTLHEAGSTLPSTRPATETEERAYAAVIAELDLHRHSTLRPPLNAFRNAATDLQRAAVADQLPEALEQEITRGGLSPDDVQPILDNWTYAHSLPRIVCNMRRAA